MDDGSVPVPPRSRARSTTAVIGSGIMPPSTMDSGLLGLVSPTASNLLSPERTIKVLFGVASSVS